MIKGKLTISRPQCSSGEKYINIEVEDDDARIVFLTLKISLENFAEAITGLASSGCEFEVGGLENVGKIKEHDTMVFLMPAHDWNSRNKIAHEEAKKHTPEGWEASTYFGSQDSFFRKDGAEYARTNIYRWVDKDTGG